VEIGKAMRSFSGITASSFEKKSFVLPLAIWGVAFVVVWWNGMVNLENSQPITCSQL
jgi:hypothetical protein